MSTELGSIQAKIEIPNKTKRTSDYITTEVILNRFWGGSERGASLQITFLNESLDTSHIQLDSKTIKQLKEILNTEF